jgi:hypothetical protein
MVSRFGSHFGKGMGALRGCGLNVLLGPKVPA